MVNTRNIPALKPFWDYEPKLMQDLGEEIYEDLDNSYEYAPAAFPHLARFEAFHQRKERLEMGNGGGMAQQLSKMDGYKDTENQHLHCFVLLHLECETYDDKTRKRDTTFKCLLAAGAYINFNALGHHLTPVLLTPPALGKVSLQLIIQHMLQKVSQLHPHRYSQFLSQRSNLEILLLQCLRQKLL